MSTTMNISREELLSALADMQDQEGVLVCKGEQAGWDEMAISRAFATFQFSPSTSGTDGSGLSFCHDDSGTIVNYLGRALTIECGGLLVDAMGDLLLVLNAVGWVDIDVYSINGEDFFNDLAQRIPARIADDINIQLQETPDEVGSEELAALSASISSAAGGATPQSSAAEFMTEFRRGENLEPAKGETSLQSAAVAAPATQEMQPRRVISLNTPSPVSAPSPASSPAPLSPTPARPAAEPESAIAHTYGGNSLDLPIPQPIPADDDTQVLAQDGTANVVEPAPVAEPPKLGVSIPQLVAAPVPASVQIVNEQVTETASPPSSPAPVEPAALPSTDDPIEPTAVEATPAALVPASVVSVSSHDGALTPAPADHYLPFVGVELAGVPTMRIGSAMFVRLSPGEEIPEAELALLKAQLPKAGPLRVIRCGLAATDSTEARRWQPFDEMPIEFEDSPYLDTARTMTRSLWPSLDIQDQMLATALLLAVKGTAGAGGHEATLRAVLDLATAGVEAVADSVGRVTRKGFPAEQLQKLISMSFIAGNQAPAPKALSQVAASLVSLLFEGEPAAGGEDFSLAAILKSGAPTLVIVQHDSMDFGGLNEVLSAGFWSFVSAIKASGRYAGIEHQRITDDAEISFPDEDENKPLTRKDFMEMFGALLAKHQPRS